MIDIDARAQEIAHENSPACRNRPAVYANQGHGKSCDKLTRQIIRRANSGGIGCRITGGNHLGSICPDRNVDISSYAGADVTLCPYCGTPVPDGGIYHPPCKPKGAAIIHYSCYLSLVIFLSIASRSRAHSSAAPARSSPRIAKFSAKPTTSCSA